MTCPRTEDGVGSEADIQVQALAGRLPLLLLPKPRPLFLCFLVFFTVLVRALSKCLANSLSLLILGEPSCKGIGEAENGTP